jgi:hypothetical protein
LDAITDYKRINEWEGHMLHLFAGDLIHSRTALNIVVGNIIQNSLYDMGAEEILTKAIKGNHDLYYRRAPVSSLELFEPHLEIIDGGESFELTNGWTLFVYGIPFCATIEEIKDRLKAAKKARKGDVNILVMHYGISGAIVGPHDYKLKSELTRSVVKLAGYDWTLCGHYHTMQDLGDGILVPGSPIQHNFGERGQAKGFLLIDLEEATWEQIPIDAPEFKVVELEGELTDDWREDLGVDEWYGNYIKVVFDNIDTYRDFELHVETLKTEGVLSITRELRGVKRTDNQGRVDDLDYEMSLPDLVKSYVKSAAPRGKRKALESVGNMILELASAE